jgi:molybdopterin molybdotransferase
LVEPFTFEQARACVLAHARSRPTTEDAALLEASGRVLAEAVTADRDYPPLARSVRDGFAVRSSDLPGELRVIGEIRAGEPAEMEVHPGEAVEIMTGAPMPRGADAVVMVEHTNTAGGRMTTERSHRAGDNVNPRASEARTGEVLLSPGTRLGFPEIALLAMLGRPGVSVYRRPQVAIVSTGDEVVEIEDRPTDFQVRNSNAYSLAAQVRRAGGCPRVLPIAKDLYESTRELVERGLECDLLLLSGGVSAGKYDLVERVLGDLGAEFFFDRVLIQPGQPLVFGRARGNLFFGLPGNPASTMVTYEVFGRSAQELLEGQAEAPLPIVWGRLTKDFRQKPGLTRFLPARLGGDGDVTPTGWSGSGDIPALARANAFLVTEPGRESWSAGEMIRVLPR